MHRSPMVRILTLLVALVGSLAAPVQGLTHGVVHAHLAEEHRHEHHDEHSPGSPVDATTRTLDQSRDDHAHGHAKLDALPTGRQFGKLDVAAIDVAELPAPVALAERVVDVREPIRHDPLLLARPGPEGGPPPRLRAPPIG